MKLLWAVRGAVEASWGPQLFDGQIEWDGERKRVGKVVFILAQREQGCCPSLNSSYTTF